MQYGSTDVCLEVERIWMGKLIVMIMIGPVGVIVDSIITVVGISLKRELNFSLLDLENISSARDRKNIRLYLILSPKQTFSFQSSRIQSTAYQLKCSISDKECLVNPLCSSWS